MQLKYHDYDVTMSALDLEMLHDAVAGAFAGIKRTTMLMPVGDPKVFPSTYEGGRYATEVRKIRQGDHVVEVKTVLLDSVQSQANRMELALLRAYQAGKVQFPLVEIDFATGESEANLAEIGKLTVLEVPHRIADALVRNSEYCGVAFRESDPGKKLDFAKSANATPLMELCPTALIFGFWDSTGPRGGAGAKVQRALVSEIVGYDIAVGVRASSRIDPVVPEGVDVFVKPDGGWTVDRGIARTDANGPVKYGKKGKVSELNLGNVTPSLGKEETPNHGGVTMAYAEQTTVLSLAALRRLRFPVEGADESRQNDVNDAARTLLAALGLAATCALDKEGYDLRSRCLLDGEPGQFAFVGHGAERTFKLSADQAFVLTDRAAKSAVQLGLPWPVKPLTLRPSADLRLLVLMSRRKSMAVAAE